MLTINVEKSLCDLTEKELFDFVLLLMESNRTIVFGKSVYTDAEQLMNDIAKECDRLFDPQEYINQLLEKIKNLPQKMKILRGS